MLKAFASVIQLMPLSAELKLFAFWPPTTNLPLPKVAAFRLNPGEGTKPGTQGNPFVPEKVARTKVEFSPAATNVFVLSQAIPLRGYGAENAFLN
jgi:hypothetical protein